ncbi:type II toxin-antitoxin system PrlF family antitoxin [Pseudanabaenaceae cyanobacterium LEGE 13415]|nr:type II toxin-antitoxin system PrlF family antitoxin [Pseudanabaenaceae cyanobacterium LEGE 13415]
MKKTSASQLESRSNPALEKFLDFLAEDVCKYPQPIRSINFDLMNRLCALVADVEVDLDAPLSDEDE